MTFVQHGVPDKSNELRPWQRAKLLLNCQRKHYDVPLK